MKSSKLGGRVIVIAGTAPAGTKPGYREVQTLKCAPRRIVVIRNGEIVASRSSR